MDRTRECAQEAARRGNANGTPLWALVAILVLGFDEAMSLLYNPIYLILAGLLFIVCKNVYSRLNVEEYMAMGLVPGLIALAPKVGDTDHRHEACARVVPPLGSPRGPGGGSKTDPVGV